MYIEMLHGEARPPWTARAQQRHEPKEKSWTAKLTSGRTSCVFNLLLSKTFFRRQPFPLQQILCEKARPLTVKKARPLQVKKARPLKPWILPEALCFAARMPGPAIFEHFVPPTVSLSAAAELRQDGYKRNHLREAIRAPLEIDTIYGKILQSTSVVLTDGETHTWEYTNPFAWLHQMCNWKPRFGDMLRDARRQHGKISLVFYQDEIKPGNILRPDQGRTLVCFYWTIAELPSWFRARHNGWFHFAMFPLALVDRVAGGHSFLFTFMVKTFFGKGPMAWDFSTTGICCKTTAENILLVATFSCLLADEKALVQLWCTKGASSYKPCHLCKNVMGRNAAPAGHAYLVPYTCTDADRFDLHSVDSFQNMARLLKIAKSDENPKRFDKLEKAYGLIYHPLGLPWCSEIVDMCNPISNNCWDWMHILLASGGVAQYNFCQFVRRLCQQTGVGFGALDQFAAQIQWPKKSPSWPKDFFGKRIVNEDDSHVKAFASEMFQCMDTLNMLVDVLVRPANILQQETACLESMMNIIFLLSLQEGVLEHIPKLESEIAKHHVLFLDLYPECNKPKTHWLRHVPAQLLELKCNLSCFSPERKHKGVKTLASKVFSQVEKGVFYRALAEDLAAFLEERSVVRVFLLRPKSLASDAWLQPLFPGMQAAYGSKTLRFEGGFLQRKDLIWFPRENILLEAEVFLEVRLLSSSTFLICGVLFDKQAVDKKTFQSTNKRKLLACAPDMKAISFCLRDGGIFPCTRLACT